MKTIPGARALESTVRAVARRNPENPVFLVGGAVRDRLLGRKTSDFDFALRSGEADLARDLERSGFGRAVRISPEASPFPVWRLSRPGLTVDIARFENASSIEGDLARRDFTANALARDVLSGRFIDPFGGLADLREKRIRMVSARNLDADPIRVLRAYRLAATLGWTIERRTRAALALRAAALAAEARERTHAEMVRLFSAPRASRPIGWASRDGILAACLSLPDVPAGVAARILAPFDDPRLEGRLRFFFRLATLFFRSEIGPNRVSILLGERGFSRTEVSSIALEVRFLSAAFSDAPAARVLFAFRGQWKDLGILLRLAARGRSESRRARALAGCARRCNFRPPPVDGRDIARWLAIPPGKRLGRALERATFLYFTRAARTRAEIEVAARSFDEPGTEE